MWLLVSIALVVLAGALPAAGGAPGEALPGVEEQLVEKKLHLAQVYRFRGQRDRALELVRQVQTIRPADEAAARLAVELWQAGWDEQIVRHIEESPGKIALRPLDELVDVKAVGAALIASLTERTDFRAYREAALIAPYVRPAHAGALGKLVKDGDASEKLTAAAMLCVLGDSRGDEYVRSWLSERPRNAFDGAHIFLLAYASPKTWKKALQVARGPTVRMLALNIAYAGEADALKQMIALARAMDIASLEAAIAALIELGERDRAAKAVLKYRVNHWSEKTRGPVGHKLLIYYATLGDAAQFFEIFDEFEEELRTPLALTLAAHLHVAAGRREEALSLIRPVLDELEAKIEQDPEDADLYFRLADTIAVAGTDPERARALVLEALRHHARSPLRPRLYELLARLYLEDGKLEQVEVLADGAVALYSADHPRYVGLKRRVSAKRKAAPEEP